MKLKLLNNKEIKNASWLIFGKIVQMVVALFVNIVTARYLGPDNYGLINYGTAYVAFFSSLCTLGINSIIIKDFVDHPDEQGIAIGSSIFMRFLSSVLSCFMIIGFCFVVDGNEPITIAVVALCSLGTIFHVFEIFNYWFQNQYKSKITSLATLCAYILTAVYKIVLLILKFDVSWFAFSTSVDYIAIAVFLYIAYKKHNGPKLKVSLSKSCDLLKNSYHYILSSMMVAIYGQTDKLMLKQFLNETEVGYYATAVAICGMWTFVLQAIIDSLYPSILRLKNSDECNYRRKNKQLYAIVFYVSGFVSLVFLLGSEIFVNILYGKAFLPASNVLRVITWYTAFSYMGVARNAWIVSEGKQKYLKYIYALAALMNICLNLIFIPEYGAVGAAVASLITQICTSIVLPMFIKDLRPNAKLILESIVLKF